MKKSKRKVLILTDHTNHSSENSLYPLATEMLTHPNTDCVDVVSRGNGINQGFFFFQPDANLWATRISKAFNFKKQGHPLSVDYQKIDIKEYDLVWLRMPPPLSQAFLKFVQSYFKHALIINDPKHIRQTGSKEFLLNFQSLCPPLKMCYSLDDINEFRKRYPVVLKPLNDYGGRGILKIEKDTVSEGKKQMSFEDFSERYLKAPVDYLGVKYLKNVHQGDKRIVVVHGEILGASLRLPAQNSWLCNVSMGGTSNICDIEPEEVEIINQVDPILSKHGIVMYGVDTLVDDDGKRVLSEINTTSIGGLPQMAAMKKEPLVEKAIDLIWNYFNEKYVEHE